MLEQDVSWVKLLDRELPKHLLLHLFCAAFQADSWRQDFFEFGLAPVPKD